ncbi:hypothetical protein H4Q26_007011 [Puccinia striiformis f. sp. tritici PST-130]|nr:hypothetical protein H4Q26_007011 [Puccinia striiformis f. sp. tritici PST-130]
MCKHILNAQVSIRAQCCRKWFDCAECHVEQEPDHKLFKSTEMVMMCKKCKKPFRKIVEEFEESDEYCPHCDNHYILEAKTPNLSSVSKLKTLESIIEAYLLAIIEIIRLIYTLI